jgi:hypothetical protein
MSDRRRILKQMRYFVMEDLLVLPWVLGGRRLGGLREIPGFASPPRDGFALGDYVYFGARGELY